MTQISTSSDSRTPGAVGLAAGLLALATAGLLAGLLHAVVQRFGGGAERNVMLVAVALCVAGVIPPATYLSLRRKSAQPQTAGLVALTTLSVLLAAVYFYWVSPSVMFPADILIWSEGDFVGNIIKWRVGHPLYTPEQNNESSIYTPGAHLATYFLASLVGRPQSIPCYRAVQVGFTILAAVIAAGCCRLLWNSESTDRDGSTLLWPAWWLPTMFLFAGNSLTNPYVHCLHNDALCQLISIGAYWLLLKYGADQDVRWLSVMAVVPAAGFLVKQSLLLWAAIYCIYLAAFVRPLRWGRLAAFALGTAAATGLTLSGCYAAWGSDFVYWTFTVLGEHAVSPLRSVQHALAAWTYFAVGGIGGLLVFGTRISRPLLGAWLTWLFVLGTETYTSGIAWMLNHLGPGCLIAGVWFLAGIARVWPRVAESGVGTLLGSMRTAIAVGVVGMSFAGLGVVRIPVPQVASDEYRYIGEIERAFAGGPPDRVLLDVGNWVYAPTGIVMRDRAASIGDRIFSGIADLSHLLRRIEGRHYSKILVRHFDEWDFWYDTTMCPPTGVRDALRRHYREAGTIAAVTPQLGTGRDTRYTFGEITILVPREPLAKVPEHMATAAASRRSTTPTSQGGTTHSRPARADVRNPATPSEQLPRGDL